MSRIMRVAVLVTALMSFFAVLSSTAGAVTWHNTGSTAYTATSGPMTLSVGANIFACTGSSDTGTAHSGSTVGAHVNWMVTRRWNPCTLVGQATSMHCVLEYTGISAGVGIA